MVDSRYTCPDSIRSAMEVSHTQFAQCTSVPSGAAKTLLKVAASNPKPSARRCEQIEYLEGNLKS